MVPSWSENYADGVCVCGVELVSMVRWLFFYFSPRMDVRCRFLGVGLRKRGVCEEEILLSIIEW